MAASRHTVLVRVVSISATPASLPSSGGESRLRAQLQHATTCRISSTAPLPRLPVALGCSAGSATLELSLPANRRTAAEVYEITLTAADGRTQIQRQVAITVAGVAQTQSGVGAPAPPPAPAATSTVTTQPATAAVAEPPVVTRQPASGETLPSGHAFVIYAAATASPAPAVQWQVSTNGGGWTPVTAGASSSNAGGVTSSQYAGNTSAIGSVSYRAVFSNAAGSEASSAETLTVIPATSYNWAGYVASGATFSGVVGHWTVPALSCAGRATSVASEWVGIDGWSGATDVEQDGTETDCNHGIADYYAWYELAGDAGNAAANDGAQVPLPRQDRVLPGDVVTAAVLSTHSTWTFQLSDLRGGSPAWSFTSSPVPDYAPAPPQIYADWIVEWTNEGVASPPLSSFGSVSFAGAAASVDGTQSPISALQYMAVGMYAGSNDLVAAPGPLAPNGAGFTDTYGGSG